LGWRCKIREEDEKGGEAMQEKENYRHELKYEIDYGTFLALRSRLRPVMKPDSHAGQDGCYRVRSIYFDNLDDKALREKINGVSRREKFRIRYYNDDFSFILLEKKMKHNSLCLKCDAQISEQECRAVLEGRWEWMPEHSSDLVREFYCKLKGGQLRPRVLVSYLREPYIYPAGNVRVTFDSQIRTSLYHRRFLEKQVRDISALDAPGQMILEVKYDNFLPEIISLLLQSGRIRQGAFSKYGVCRRFG